VHSADKQPFDSYDSFSVVYTGPPASTGANRSASPWISPQPTRRSWRIWR